MQTGVHVVEYDRWTGRDPADGYGVVDFCRTVAGTGDEPEGDRPIVVTGLVDLLEPGGDVADRLQPVRRALHRGKHYFEWRDLPVVFLVRGTLSGRSNEAPALEIGEATWSLDSLFGTGLEPLEEDDTDWWYAPQFD